MKGLVQISEGITQSRLREKQDIFNAFNPLLTNLGQVYKARDDRAYAEDRYKIERKDRMDDTKYMKQWNREDDMNNPDWRGRMHKNADGSFSYFVLDPATNRMVKENATLIPNEDGSYDRRFVLNSRNERVDVNNVSIYDPAGNQATLDAEDRAEARQIRIHNQTRALQQGRGAGGRVSSRTRQEYGHKFHSIDGVEYIFETMRDGKFLALPVAEGEGGDLFIQRGGEWQQVSNPGSFADIGTLMKVGDDGVEHLIMSNIVFESAEGELDTGNQQHNRSKNKNLQVVRVGRDWVVRHESSGWGKKNKNLPTTIGANSDFIASFRSKEDAESYMNDLRIGGGGSETGNAPVTTRTHADIVAVEGLLPGDAREFENNKTRYSELWNRLSHMVDENGARFSDLSPQWQHKLFNEEIDKWSHIQRQGR